MPRFKPVFSLAGMMAFRDFLGSAKHVDDEVSAIHGMFATSKANNHELLLFNNIKEAPGHRSALNLLTRARLCNVLGIAPESFLDLLRWAMNNPIDPEIVESGVVMEQQQEQVNLHSIPIPHHWPEDRGRYMSASVIIAERNGVRNMSFHRQFLRDDNHTVARLVPRHLRTITNEALGDGDEVKIGIVNAPDPTVLLAAAMSFDEYLDELTVAAALHQKVHNKPLKLVRLPNGVHVPADAEYAMWGRITAELDDEGPYVDITGTVDDVRQEPVIAIDGMYHRENPIFHALIPGEAEHKSLMGLPRAPTIKEAVSEVCECLDVHLTHGGCGWLSAIVKIKVQQENDAVKAIHAALDGHRSMKMVTVVDEDIDIEDPVRVEWAMATRWQPDKDTIIMSGQRGSSLDPSRAEDGVTSKIGMDATLTPGADKSPFESVL